jgi:hypothetical protein
MTTPIAPPHSIATAPPHTATETSFVFFGRVSVLDKGSQERGEKKRRREKEKKKRKREKEKKRKKEKKRILRLFRLLSTP